MARVGPRSTAVRLGLAGLVAAGATAYGTALAAPSISHAGTTPTATGQGSPSSGGQDPTSSTSPSDSHSQSSDGTGAPPKSHGQGPATDDLPTSAAAGVKALTAPGAPTAVLGRTVAAAPATGTVRVEPAGSRSFVALGDAASVPVGSVIDARAGTVVLATAVAGAPEQMASLGGGEFRVDQSPSAKGLTDIYLAGGSFAGCGASRPNAHAGAYASRSARSRHAVVRTLWASDNHGQFRTHGHSSVAAVRGTSWVTVDRCDGTLTSVSKGLVSVRDLNRHRTVLVSAGHSHLAPAR